MAYLIVIGKGESRRLHFMVVLLFPKYVGPTGGCRDHSNMVWSHILFINGRAHLSKEFSYHQHADDKKKRHPVTYLHLEWENGRCSKCSNLMAGGCQTHTHPRRKETNAFARRDPCSLLALTNQERCS